MSGSSEKDNAGIAESNLVKSRYSREEREKNEKPAGHGVVHTWREHSRPGEADSMGW